MIPGINCGKEVLQALIKAIQENKDYLSEIDGAIGDGDHGINMNKGFTMALDLLNDDETAVLPSALDGLGSILFNDIGGSMGPIYGTLFIEMSEAAEDAKLVDAGVILKMITAGREGLQEIGNAQVGDKTLIDTLVAAENALSESVSAGQDFVSAMDAMIAGAEQGMESTRDMVAKLGRAARLGERSRGVLDAGATSCYLILQAMGLALKELAVT